MNFSRHRVEEQLGRDEFDAVRLTAARLILFHHHFAGWRCFRIRSAPKLGRLHFASLTVFHEVASSGTCTFALFQVLVCH